MTAEDKMLKAKVRLMLDQPFYCALLLYLKWQENARVTQTMATDGVSLFWNRTYVDSLTLELTMTVLAHEALHCALLHPLRRGNRDPQAWNEAADEAINNSLEDYNEEQKQKFPKRQPPFEWPEGVLLDRQYKGMAAEEIYAKRKPKPQDGQGGQKPQQSDHPDQPDDDGQDDGQPDPQGQPSPQSGQGKGKPGKGQGQSAGGQGGQPDDGGQPDQQPAPGGMGDVLDAPGDASQKDEIEAKWKEALVNAAETAKQQGKLPGDIVRLVDEMLNPKPKWQEVLRRFIRDRSKDDYSFMRPNMRYAHTGFMLPSLDSQRVGKIAVAIDTSGSIGGPELNEFLDEVAGLVSECRPAKLVMLDCDARVNARWELDPDDPLPRKFHGGGGTSHEPIWEALKDEEILCCVCLTDLYTTFGSEPPYPILWATKTKGITPPFGEVVEIV